MQVEQDGNGWRVTGKTWDHRDQLKALRGRWDAGEKCWRLPADVDLYELSQLAGQALSRLSPDQQARQEARQNIEDLGQAGAIHACDAVFTGNTFACKELLKSFGARWDPQRKAWTIEGSFNRNALEEALDDAGLDWNWYTPHCYSQGSNMIFVDLGFDEARHERLQSGCDCSGTETCRACLYACCNQAIPRCPDDLDLGYDCPHHGFSKF